MTLLKWTARYPGCIYRRNRQSLTVYVPNDKARSELASLADYRLVRTDYYKGWYYGLLERKYHDAK